MTIASNYKVKNPDVIFKPAYPDDWDEQKDFSQNELDRLLESINNNNL